MATTIEIDVRDPRWAQALDDLSCGKLVLLQRNGSRVARLAVLAGSDDEVAIARGYGMDAGRTWIADDFDDTPNSLIAAFEGEAPEVEA